MTNIWETEKDTIFEDKSYRWRRLNKKRLGKGGTEKLDSEEMEQLDKTRDRVEAAEDAKVFDGFVKALRRVDANYEQTAGELERLIRDGNKWRLIGFLKKCQAKAAKKSNCYEAAMHDYALGAIIALEKWDYEIPYLLDKFFKTSDSDRRGYEFMD